MGTPWSENLCAHRIGTIEKLIKDQARDTAAQLQILSEKPTGDHDGPEELLVELLNSFTKSLSHISLCSCEDCECEVTQIPNRVGSPISDQRSVNSGEGCKRPEAEDRRGCYKRRKISEMSTEVLSTTNEDGHAWRKYGQTKILEAQFPMCYYTCTHKFDQGCQATKRVQRIQEALHMYRTTYFGHHTCRSYSLNNPLLEAHLRSFSSKTFSSDSESHSRSFSSIAISTQYTSSCPSSAASVRKECWGESGGIVLSNSLAGYFRDAPIVWSLVKSLKILNMNNLCFLSLRGSSQIKELPFSVSELPNLEGLFLAECTKLVNLAELLNLKGSVCPFPNLEELFLEGCTKRVMYVAKLLDLEELVCPSPNLEELVLRECPKLVNLAGGNGLFMKLRCLGMSYCTSSWAGG